MPFPVYLKAISLIVVANRWGYDTTIRGSISFVWHSGSYYPCDNILMQSVYAIHFKVPLFFLSFFFWSIHSHWNSFQFAHNSIKRYSHFQHNNFSSESAIYLRFGHFSCGILVYTVHCSIAFDSISHRHSIQNDLRFPFDVLDTKMAKEIQIEILHWIFQRILMNESQFVEMVLNSAIFFYLSISLFSSRSRFLLLSFFSSAQ